MENGALIDGTIKGLAGYRTFVKKIIILVIVFSFMPLIILNFLLRDYFMHTYSEKVISRLSELAQKNTNGIDNFLHERLKNILFLTSSNSLERLLDERFLQETLYNLSREYGGEFVDIGVVDAKGIQIAYAGNFKLVSANYSETEWFKTAIKRDYFISDVFLGLRGKPHFIVTATKVWKGERYIVRATIDFSAFNHMVESVTIGKSGFVFIINKKGEFQTGNIYKLTQNSGTIYLDFLMKAQIFQVDKIHINTKSEFNGKSYINIVMPLNDGAWRLIFQQEEDEAFIELYRARIIAISVLLFGILGTVFIFYYMSSKLITFIERAEDERQKMNAKMIESGKLVSLGELAAGIAHEINNPVAIMVEEAGWMQDLLTEEEFKESQNLSEFNRSLAQIKQQGMRCKDITFKLLSFARKTDPRAVKVSINDLISDIIKLIKQRTRFNHVEVETSMSGDIPEFYVSPSEMQQVILNFLNNAVDAIGSNRDDGVISITTQKEGDNIAVSIKDNGHGIEKENINRIFEPFFTTKPIGKGTGIGLSICHGIIEKLGGDITVASEVGMGTVFKIIIPISRNLKTEQAI